MPINEVAGKEVGPLNEITFSLVQLQERRDLQRLLRANISVVAPDTLGRPSTSSRNGSANLQKATYNHAGCDA